MTNTVFPSGVKPFSERPLPKTICMFDVDGTLSLARQQATPLMMATLAKLRQVCAIAFVGGSDLNKIREQLAVDGLDANMNAWYVINAFDYAFAENGLTAYRLGQEMPPASFIGEVGEEEYKKLVNFVLRYLSEVDIPIKRGTFIEFRKGMVNISPLGRNASIQERNDFNDYDKVHGIRKRMVEVLEKEFAHLNLSFSIGGQISFDVFPKGWDKTYALGRIEADGFTDIHFFGDKTFPGGNDYEIYSDKRTIGHSVANPDETMKILNELFLSKY